MSMVPNSRLFPAARSGEVSISKQRLSGCSRVPFVALSSASSARVASRIAPLHPILTTQLRGSSPGLPIVRPSVGLLRRSARARKRVVPGALVSVVLIAMFIFCLRQTASLATSMASGAPGIGVAGVLPSNRHAADDPELESRIQQILAGADENTAP